MAPKFILKSILKRPTASPKSILKKPSVWNEWADKELQKEEAEAVDDTAITPCQRHVFQKALKLPAGHPQGLTPAVLESWGAAQTGHPRDRARVINVAVPKHVTYKDTFDPKGMNLQKVAKLTNTHSTTKHAEGKTRTQMEVEWGFGNTEVGRANVDLAIARKHLFEKNGLLYTVGDRVEMKATNKNDMIGTSAGSVDEWQMLEKTLASLECKDWAADKTIADTKVKPPSIEGRAHIEQAQAMCIKCIDEIKASSKMLASRNTPPHLVTWGSVLVRAWDLVRQVQLSFTEKVDGMICMNEIQVMADSDLKGLLAELQPKFQELQACAVSLKQAVHASKPK